MRKDKKDCCCSTFNTTLTNFLCTIPVGTPHAEHESWSAFGCWSKDPTCGGEYKAGSTKMNKIWPNLQYAPPAQPYKKLEKPTLDMSDWADDWDCLPDA